MAPMSSRCAVSTSPSPLRSRLAAAVAAARESTPDGSAWPALSSSARTLRRSPVMLAPRQAASASRRALSVPVALNSEARSRVVMAATASPRRRVLYAASCSRAATWSSGPTAASARCRARCSEPSGSSAASARCAHRRSSLVDRSITAERVSGCRNSSRPVPPSTCTRPARSAGDSPARPSGPSDARCRMCSSPEPSSTASSSSFRVAAGSAATRVEKTSLSRSVNGSTAGRVPHSVCCKSSSGTGSSSRARGLPRASATSRRRTLAAIAGNRSATSSFAAASSSGRTSYSGIPMLFSNDSSPVLDAPSRAIGPACGERPRVPRTMALDRSTHAASSTISASGPVSVAVRVSRACTAFVMASSSAGCSSDSPRTAWRVSACHAGSAGIPSASRSNSWFNTEKPMPFW
jgi:hypothetical protein